MATATEPEKAKAVVTQWMVLNSPASALNARSQATSLYAALEKVDKERKEWSGTVKVGLKSDEAHEKSHHEVPSGVTITKGTFPNELRFSAETDITLDNSKTTEDVTSLLANFDHHIDPNLEIYAFVERFSDNFMAIDRRYEAGIGFRVGRWWGRPRISQELATSGLYDFPVGRIRESRGDRLPNEVSDFLDQLDVARTAIETMKSPLFVGVAFSAFQELEQAQRAVQDTIKKEELIVRPGGDSQIRYAVRPTVCWRATSDLTLSTMWYFKYTDHFSNSDLRIDGTVKAALKLEETSGMKSVAIVAEYGLRYDSAPPVFTVRDLQKAGVTTVGYDLRGPLRHESLRLGVEIGI